MEQHWWRMLRARVFFGAALGIVVFVALPETMTLPSRIAIAWLSYIALQLVIVFRTVGGRHADELRAWAPQVNLGGASFAIFLVVSAAVSVMASIFVLRAAAGETEGSRLFHLLLGASTVLVTWFGIQTTFAVRYACMYYGTPGHTGEEGLRFPGSQDPDFWDFLYFSTCAGMTFEASDVAVTRKPFRRWLTFHAIFSFVFATINLALLVDIAANLI